VNSTENIWLEHTAPGFAAIGAFLVAVAVTAKVVIVVGSPGSFSDFMIFYGPGIAAIVSALIACYLALEYQETGDFLWTTWSFVALSPVFSFIAFALYSLAADGS
jgi:hypothetical protein